MPYEKLKKKGISHVCLRVPDLEVTRKFYMDALDATLVCEWGPDGKPDHAYLLDLGEGDVLEIFQDEKIWETGSWQHVALWADDIRQSVRRALDAGATLLHDVSHSDIPTRSGQIVRMDSAFVKAPGGETVEFIQYYED